MCCLFSKWSSSCAGALQIFRPLAAVDDLGRHLDSVLLPCTTADSIAAFIFALLMPPSLLLAMLRRLAYGAVLLQKSTSPSRSSNSLVCQWSRQVCAD